MTEASVVHLLGAKDRIGATSFAIRLAKVLSEDGKKICLVNSSFAGDLQAATKVDFVRSYNDLRTFLSFASGNRLQGYLSRVDDVHLLEAGRSSCEDEIMSFLSDSFDIVIFDHGASLPHDLMPGVWLLVTCADERVCNALKNKITSLIDLGVMPSKMAVVANVRAYDELRSVSSLFDGMQIFQSQALSEIRSFISRVHCDRKAVSLDGEELAALKKRLIDIVVNSPEMKGCDPSVASSLRELASNIASKHLSLLCGKMNDAEFRTVVRDVVSESLGLGPIEAMSGDPDISEIMVNSFDKIFVERNGKLERSVATFSSEASLRRVIERIVSPLGRRVDEASPMVDARLADGSRVNVIIPPISLNGPVLTIRRFLNSFSDMRSLIESGALSLECAAYLESKVKARANILVSGGTGSGKTTLLNVLSSFIDESERIVCVEDSSELRLAKPHVVRLESRPPNIEGGGEITIRDLVRNAMRMRPDRIIVGECRGGEALDMLQAMNTGHMGSMTTIHANTAKDSLSRLETLVLFANVDLPSCAIRQQIASAISVVVHLVRQTDGSRRVGSILELKGIEAGEFLLEKLDLKPSHEK